MGTLTLVWDWNLHCPALISNAIISTLVPKDVLTSEKTTIAKVRSKYQLKNYEALIFGGISAGVNFSAVQQKSDKQWIHDDDIEVLLVNNENIIGSNNAEDAGFAEIEETDKGFVKLRLRDPNSVHSSLTHTEGSCTYLRSDLFLQSIPDLKTGECLPYPEVDFQNIQNKNVKTPAWKQICALKSSQWPSAANEWLTRPRSHGFPSEQLIKDIEKEGCFLVPKESRLGAKPCTSWMYSFANAERTLMNSLSTLQKHVYVILKILCFQKLSSPCVIETCHLRAMYLDICERIPAALQRPDDLTQQVMFTIDSLLHLLINSSLPHYFIKEIDLLEGLSEDFLDQLQGIVADIRVKALDVLLDFCQDFDFNGTHMLRSDVFEPLHNVVNNSIFPETAIDCVVKVIVPFLVRFTRSHFEGDGNTCDEEKEMEALKEFHKLAERVLKENNIELGDHFWYLPLREYEDDLFWQIRLHEYIVQYADCKNVTSFKSNLACHYHTAFCLGHEEYKSKAQKMFESCLDAPDHGIANLTDYAVFLCKTENWERAHQILCDIMKLNATGESNGYNEKEIQTLEAGFQDLAKALGKIEHVPARSLAFYLLLITYVNLSKEESTISSTLNDFQAWCKSPLASDSVSNALLALAYEKCCRYKEALDAYTHVAKEINANGQVLLEGWLSKKIPACRNLLHLEKTENAKDSPANSSSSQNGIENEVSGQTQEPHMHHATDDKEDPATPANGEDDIDEELQRAIALSLQTI